MRCTNCSSTVKPVVAIDIDGTLGNYYGHFVQFCNAYFGTTFPNNWEGQGEWEDFLGLTRQQYREAKLAYRQGGQKRSMPMISDAPHLIAAVRKLSVEVWLTTTRPWLRLDSVDPDTREWLRREDVYYDHLLYDDDKYHRLAELVDPERVLLVVDDLKELCVQAEDAFGFSVPYQVKRKHNTHSDARYGTRGNLHHAAAIIESRAAAWNRDR